MSRLRMANLDGGAQKYRTRTRAPTTKRRQWCRRTSRKLTEMEKYRIKQLRMEVRESEQTALEEAQQVMWKLAADMHDRLGRHTALHYFRLIMHQTRLKAGSRKANRWNAYLSQEIEKRNDALPPGAEKLRVSDTELTREIAATWNSMSAEEQVAATEDRMRELEERRENTRIGSHTFPLNAFHDMRATLATVTKLLEDLYVWTGTETFMVNVRASTTDYMQPQVFQSSDRIADFVVMATGGNGEAFAARMEGFCISGIQGVAHNYIQTLLNLKKTAATLILACLRSASTRGDIGRMSYANFDTNVTGRIGVVVDHWPLKTFCSPGEICSMPELEILIQAFKTGRTRFCALTDEEWAEWKEKRAAIAPPSDNSEVPGNPDVLEQVSLSMPVSSPPSIASSVPALSPSSPPALSPSSTPALAPSSTPALSPSTGLALSHSSAQMLSPLPPAPASPAESAPSPRPLSSESALSSSSSTESQPLSTPASESSSLPTGKRARRGVEFVHVDVVTGADGRPMAIAKRTRKPRVAKPKSSAGSSTAAPALSSTTSTATSSSPATTSSSPATTSVPTPSQGKRGRKRKST